MEKHFKRCINTCTGPGQPSVVLNCKTSTQFRLGIIHLFILFYFWGIRFRFISVIIPRVHYKNTTTNSQISRHPHLGVLTVRLTTDHCGWLKKRLAASRLSSHVTLILKGYLAQFCRLLAKNRLSACEFAKTKVN